MPSVIDDSVPTQGEIWHPYWLLEEVAHNMWGTVDRRDTWLEIARVFTGDNELYGSWMQKVVHEWPRSCEHALSKPGDKRAWIGHAAVAMAIRCPEDIVRAAWGLLTDEQRIAANNQAQRAINSWEGQCQKEV